MPQQIPRLTATSKKLVRKASRTHIAGYFAEGGSALRRNRWLSDTNRYRKNCIETYRADLSAPPVNDYQLIRYVAASSPTHLIDGWSFFSRGIDAALKGDVYSAIHFGYYAELRAAMALLAAEGIGIFNDQHPIVVSNKVCDVLSQGLQIWQPSKKAYKRIGSGTHKLVWPCLDQWSRKPDSGVLLGQILKPGGMDLHHWLAAAKLTVPQSALMQRWLEKWGVDLAATSNDRARRNIASYRPSELRPPAQLPAAGLLDFLDALWRLFEPGSPATRFPTMERHLLRDALRTSTKTMPSAGDLLATGLGAAEATDWATFLAAPEAMVLINDARKEVDVDGARCHLQVLSRAALLLFVAGGAARQHIARGQISASNLEFWFERFGTERLLWPAGGTPDNVLDSWADVSEALVRLNQWRTESGGAPIEMYAVFEALPSELRRLCSFEAVAVWSLLP